MPCCLLRTRIKGMYQTAKQCTGMSIQQTYRVATTCEQKRSQTAEFGFRFQLPQRSGVSRPLISALPFRDMVQLWKPGTGMNFTQVQSCSEQEYGLELTSHSGTRSQVHFSWLLTDSWNRRGNVGEQRGVGEGTELAQAGREVRQGRILKLGRWRKAEEEPGGKQWFKGPAMHNMAPPAGVKMEDAQQCTWSFIAELKQRQEPAASVSQAAWS